MKNRMFYLIIFVSVFVISCAKDDYQNDKDEYVPQKVVLLNSESYIVDKDGTVSLPTKSYFTHDVSFVAGPGGGYISFEVPHVPFDYNYSVYSSGLLINYGSGTSRHNPLWINTTYATTYRLDFSYQCHFNDCTREGTVQFGVGNINEHCNKSFPSITFIEQAGDIAVHWLATADQNMLTPSSYKVLDQNNIEVSSGSLSSSGAIIPIPASVGNKFIIRIYSDNCTCYNPGSHYVEEKFGFDE